MAVLLAYVDNDDDRVICLCYLTYCIFTALWVYASSLKKFRKITILYLKQLHFAPIYCFSRLHHFVSDLVSCSFVYRDPGEGEGMSIPYISHIMSYIHAYMPCSLGVSSLRHLGLCKCIL